MFLAYLVTYALWQKDSKRFIVPDKQSSRGALKSLGGESIMARQSSELWGDIVSNRIGMKFHKTVVQLNIRIIWRSRVFEMASYFEHGGHDVISRRKVLPPGDCTCSVRRRLPASNSVYSSWSIDFLISIYVCVAFYDVFCDSFAPLMFVYSHLFRLQVRNCTSRSRTRWQSTSLIDSSTQLYRCW